MPILGHRTPSLRRFLSVVPTRVGVYRACERGAFLVRGRPHARGGVPNWEVLVVYPQVSSPRAWGCTALDGPNGDAGLLVPTRVGVYRHGRTVLPATVRRPHARGGVPAALEEIAADCGSSPRAWGCTGCCHTHIPANKVVP